MDDKSITHFDGAIRAYPAELYLTRIDLNIDHAGRHSEYTKLFRFDGELAIDSWKRLLSDYFRGNPLIPEYLGASPEEFTDQGTDAMAVELPPIGSVSPTVLEQLELQRDRLAAITPPPTATEDERLAIRAVVEGAFIYGFRWVMLISALLSALGSLTAWLMVDRITQDKQ